MLGYKRQLDFLRAYAVIFLMGIIAFLVRLVQFSHFGLKLQLNIFILSIVIVSFLWESLRFVNRWLNRVYPFEKNITGRIFIQIFTGAIIGLFTRFIVYLFGEPHLPIKLDELFRAATWIIFIIMTAGVNLGFFTVYFIGRWKDSIVEAERLEKEKSQVQFDNLKNQLNPHFLFNALTSLNSLIFEDQKLASEFLQQLSRVYRYVLENKDKNLVALRTELEFISNYVALLETRFRGGLKINFTIAEGAYGRSIVPVTLQILIENAIKHNVVDKEKPLAIDIFTVGDYLVIGNNVQLRKTVETSNKQGLENFRSLYKFLTDQPVVLESTEDRFYVKVPLV